MRDRQPGAAHAAVAEQPLDQDDVGEHGDRPDRDVEAAAAGEDRRRRGHRDDRERRQRRQQRRPVARLAEGRLSRDVRDQQDERQARGEEPRVRAEPLSQRRLPRSRGGRARSRGSSAAIRALAEDQHAIHQLDVLVDLGREHHDRHPLRGEVQQQRVEVALRVDVDPARRIVEQQHLRLGRQPPRHHDLLLVAARQRGDRVLGIAEHDPQRGRRTPAAARVRACDSRPPPPVALQRRDAEVLADRLGLEQRLGAALARDVRRRPRGRRASARKPSWPWPSSPARPTSSPARSSSPGDREHDLAAAGAMRALRRPRAVEVVAAGHQPHELVRGRRTALERRRRSRPTA